MPHAPHRPRTNSGRWLVLAIVALGVVLGLIGRAFRQPPPPRAGTQPATTGPVR